MAPKEQFHKYPLMSPRFWHGMRFGKWCQLVAENRFRVHPLRVPMAVILFGVTPFNSGMRLLQQWRHGRKIAETEIEQPPLFIIGHWRSGTTLLHELMVLNDQFTFPTTYQCFAPDHCLLTEWFFSNYCNFWLPKQRPMDNMAAGWKKPQEDEFALLTLGARSPYRRMAFPNNPAPDLDFLDMRNLPADELANWRAAMQYFVKMLTYQDNKRVVLKSPPHTGRIQELSQLFPGARFVHIARNPYTIFASTRRLWRSLDMVQGCQLPPKSDYLTDYVLDCLDRMYGGFADQIDDLPGNQISYTTYESLVANPVGEVERIYQELNLGDFESCRPQLEEQQRERADYKVNQHQLTPDEVDLVNQRWHAYFERFGYTIEAAEAEVEVR